VNTSLDLAAAKSPNHHATKLPHGNADEPVTQWLSPDLLDFRARKELKWQPVERSENVDDQPRRLRYRRPVRKIARICLGD
jgi:hypothetical protein